MHDFIDVYTYRGRVGLYLLLKGLGVGENDYVATQAFTCVAVPEAILATGAKPCFVDIEKVGYNMCPKDLALKLHTRVKAVVVQHTFGIPAQFESLQNICQTNGIPIIEDCCHTLNSTCNGKRVGSLGIGTFYSYEWGKPVVAGIGGSLSTNCDLLRQKVLELASNFSSPPKKIEYRLKFQYLVYRLLYRPRLYWPIRKVYRTLTGLGLAEGNFNKIQENLKSPEFNWSMCKGIKKRLKKSLVMYNKTSSYSSKIARLYGSKIITDKVIHPSVPENSKSVFCRYPLRSTYKHLILKEAMRENIEVADWYISPIHPLSFKDSLVLNYRHGSCPNAEIRCEEVITLPLHSKVTTREAQRTVDFLNYFSP